MSDSVQPQLFLMAMIMHIFKFASHQKLVIFHNTNERDIIALGLNIFGSADVAKMSTFSSPVLVSRCT